MSGEQIRPGADAEALLASFAHELRGPLNVCVMWLELLALKAEQPAEVRKAAEVMRRNLSQQAGLIRELDDIARMLGGGMELEVAATDLGRLLTPAAEGWRRAAAERGVAFSAALPAEPVEVEADAERLLQACGYWFENALAATPSGGRIALAVERRNGAAEIRFSDDGAGLEPREAERFFAAPLEGPRRQKALGLRVVIGQYLIVRHGGDVNLTSAGPDTGCTWTARIPLNG